MLMNLVLFTVLCGCMPSTWSSHRVMSVCRVKNL